MSAVRADDLIQLTNAFGPLKLDSSSKISEVLYIALNDKKKFEPFHPIFSNLLLNFLKAVFGLQTDSHLLQTTAEISKEIIVLVSNCRLQVQLQVQPYFYSNLTLFKLVYLYCQKNNVILNCEVPSDAYLINFLFDNQALPQNFNINSCTPLNELCRIKLADSDYFNKVLDCDFNFLAPFLHSTSPFYRLKLQQIVKYQGVFRVFVDFSFVNQLFKISESHKFGIQIQQLAEMLRTLRFYYNRQRVLLLLYDNKRCEPANAVFFELLKNNLLNEIQIGQLIADVANIEANYGVLRLQVLQSQFPPQNCVFALRKQVLHKPKLGQLFLLPVARLLVFLQSQVNNANLMRAEGYIFNTPQDKIFDAELRDMLRLALQIAAKTQDFDAQLERYLLSNRHQVFEKLKFWLRFLNPRLQPSRVMELANEALHFDQIAEKMRVSCADPITFRPLERPARLVACRHTHCFEFEHLVNQSICSICKQFSTFDDAYADAYLDAVIETNSSDAEPLHAVEISLKSGKIVQAYRNTTAHVSEDSDWGLL